MRHSASPACSPTPACSPHIKANINMCESSKQCHGPNKNCWKERPRWIQFVSYIIFRLIRERTYLGHPHFSNKFLEVKVIFCFHKPASCFGGPEFWNILCWNYIDWWSVLLKTMPSCVLVAFVVTRSWGPLLKFQFQPRSRAMSPPCARPQPTMFQIRLYYKPQTILGTCEVQLYLVGVYSSYEDLKCRRSTKANVPYLCLVCYFVSVSNKLSYLLVSIMLLSKDMIVIVFTVKFTINSLAST